MSVRYNAGDGVLGNRLNRFVDLHFKSSKANPSKDLLNHRDQLRNETVEAKWDCAQYFEEKASANNDSCYSSWTGSTVSSSSPASSEMPTASGKDKLDKLRRDGWRKFKKCFQMNSAKSPAKMPSSSISYNDFSGISRAPNGQDQLPPPPSGILPKIRSSKSMQSLDKLTRDSFCNLKEVTTSMKHKYHSRQELRQNKPKAEYQMFYDIDDYSDTYDDDLYRRESWSLAGIP